MYSPFSFFLQEETSKRGSLCFVIILTIKNAKRKLQKRGNVTFCRNRENGQIKKEIFMKNDICSVRF